MALTRRGPPRAAGSCCCSSSPIPWGHSGTGLGSISRFQPLTLRPTASTECTPPPSTDVGLNESLAAVPTGRGAGTSEHHARRDAALRALWIGGPTDHRHTPPARQWRL